jgi:hypothetical protein
MTTPNKTPSIETNRNNFILKRLTNKILGLKKIYFDEQSIIIKGCEHLRSVPGQHWRSKIHLLFHDAGLPRFYILDLFADKDPTTITIQLITYRAKLFVHSVLSDFFKTQKKNNIKVSIKS